MSYLSLGTQILGTILGAEANKQDQNAMMGAYNNQLGIQRNFARQGWDQFVPSLEGRSEESATKEINQGASDRMAGYNSVMNMPLNLAGPGFSASDKAILGSDAAARAKIGGYSDWTLNQWINNLRTNQALNQISNFSQGQASIFPYQMYKAQHSGDELAFWGQLLQSLGGSGSGAFGGGGGGGGSSAGGSATSFAPGQFGIGGPGYALTTGGNLNLGTP